MMVPDALAGIKDFEELEYMGTVTPVGNNIYKLVLTSKGDTEDENRKFLVEEGFTLVFEGIIANRVQFDVMDGHEKTGQFYFNYDPDTTPNTHQVHLEFMKWKGIIYHVSFSFERIRRFELKQ